MSSDSSAKPIKKWTPKKPAPGEAIPSLFAAAANTNLSVKPKPKTTAPPKHKSVPNINTATTNSNLPSLFAASASLSTKTKTNPSSTVSKPIVKKTDPTASQPSSSDHLSPGPFSESSPRSIGLPTATPAPTPVTSKPLKNSSFTVSSIHIPDTTTNTTTTGGAEGPHDSITSDLSNLPPANHTNNTNNDDDDYDDDDEKYKQATTEEEKANVNKDDDSVSISSVEVTSSEEEDEDD